MVAHAYNPSMGRQRQRTHRLFRACFTQWVPGLCRETLTNNEPLLSSTKPQRVGGTEDNGGHPLLLLVQMEKNVSWQMVWMTHIFSAETSGCGWSQCIKQRPLRRLLETTQEDPSHTVWMCFDNQKNWPKRIWRIHNRPNSHCTCGNYPLIGLGSHYIAFTPLNHACNFPFH